MKSQRSKVKSQKSKVKSQKSKVRYTGRAGFLVSRSDKSILLPPRRARSFRRWFPASAIRSQLPPSSRTSATGPNFRRVPGFRRQASTSVEPAASAAGFQLPPDPGFLRRARNLFPLKNRAVSSGQAVFRAKCRSEGTKEKAILQLFFVRDPPDAAGRVPSAAPSVTPSAAPSATPSVTLYFSLFTFHFSPSQNSRTQRR